MICLQFILVTMFLLTVNGEKVSRKCPLWHIHAQRIQCKCGSELNGIIHCDKTSLYIKFGYCMTWNNSTSTEELCRCLLTDKSHNNICVRHNIPNTNFISADISGDELDRLTCDQYNRQGEQCAYCIDGYGPAVFSDGSECVDCSKHRNLWMIYCYSCLW